MLSVVAVSAMNAVYRRNGLPLSAYIHCLAESGIHDVDLDKDDRMEVFVASDSLGMLIAHCNFSKFFATSTKGLAPNKFYT
jgi:hypothetical protein